MKIRKLPIPTKRILPFMLCAAVAMGCSSDSSTSGTDVTATPPPVSTTQPATGTVNDGTTTTGSTEMRYDATGKVDPTGNYTADGSLRPGVVLTPAQERTDAVASMNGIRATLMGELDEVRTHLKDGTLDKDHAEADKKRAADLAQGLERLDRTLAAMGGASDATWGEVRTTQLKEANDLRTWWNAHQVEREAMARN